MALREFADAEGVRWRVWDITPEQLHPITRGEDYRQGFLDGWLVFENVSGGAKRRLYPTPADWEDLDDRELERLCKAAEPAGPEARPEHAPQRPRRGPAAHVARSFLYPSGRVWSVAEVPVHYRDESGRSPDGTMTVLRFMSGQRSLDLLAWPSDWTEYDERGLAELLNRAFPRAPGGVGANTTPHRRRRSDAPR